MRVCRARTVVADEVRCQPAAAESEEQGADPERGAVLVGPRHLEAVAGEASVTQQHEQRVVVNDGSAVGLLRSVATELGEDFVGEEEASLEHRDLADEEVGPVVARVALAGAGEGKEGLVEVPLLERGHGPVEEPIGLGRAHARPMGGPGDVDPPDLEAVAPAEEGEDDEGHDKPERDK